MTEAAPAEPRGWRLATANAMLLEQRSMDRTLPA